MISIFTRDLLIKAAKYRLAYLNPQATTEQIDLVARANYSFKKNTNFYIGNLIRKNRASSLKYKEKYGNIRYLTYLVHSSLDLSASSIENVFKSYKEFLKKYSSEELLLEKSLYESRKEIKEKASFFTHINTFDDLIINDNHSLKHPSKKDYYFNRESLCDVSNNIISLPQSQSHNIYIDNVSVDLNRSSIGFSVDPANNIKTESTSHQYIIKSKKQYVNGAKLCYILDLNYKKKINFIKIIDASYLSTSVERIFYISEGDVEIDIEYQSILRGKELILLLNQAFECKRLYVIFNQSKPIDRTKDIKSAEVNILNSIYSSFDFSSEYEDKFIYEINIDKIELSYISYKKLGIIKLNEELSLAGRNKVKINFKGFFLDEVEVNAYLKYTVDKTDNFGNVETYTDKFVNNEVELKSFANNGEVILVLESIGTTKTTGFIKAVNIEVE